jgi:hypothetical protein
MQQHLPKSITTAMGHFDQLRKNLHLTHHCKQPNNKEVEQFYQDVNPDNKSTTNQAFAAMIDLHADNTLEGRSYSDLMGCFPAKSQDGNLYVQVLYKYDNNAILVEPLKNRTEGKQLMAYTKILKQVAWGTPIKMHCMDNEASAVLKTLLTKILGWHTSSYPHISIVETLQNMPYVHSKTTSLPDCVMIFPYDYGINFSPRQK